LELEKNGPDGHALAVRGDSGARLRVGQMGVEECEGVGWVAVARTERISKNG